MLATPPGFRPQHIEATIKAGKHLFAEKPVAVDGTGSARYWPPMRKPRTKDFRSSPALSAATKRATSSRSSRSTTARLATSSPRRSTGTRATSGRRPRQSGWSETEYQIRNWYHFLWLCGDHIVEQHVHNLDVACWAIGSHPVRAVGMGGRQVITEPERGQSYDHFAVDYEFPQGVHVLSMCRQIAGLRQ